MTGPPPISTRQTPPGPWVELGCGAPPVAHPLWVGPVPPHRLRSSADPHGLFDHVRCWSPSLPSSLSLLRGGARCARVRSGHSSRSAATLSRANPSDHISSRNVAASRSPSRRHRYMRRLPSGRTSTSPESVSTRRCCDTAGRLIDGKWSAISPAASSSSRTRRRMARRVGSATALNASIHRCYLPSSALHRRVNPATM